LEIHVPDLAGGKSLDLALEEVRPSFVAFLISFVVIAIAWAGHRDFVTLIRRTDRNLVWLNILYLLPV
jgi:TMEM175 potassium channel family protein